MKTFDLKLSVFEQYMETYGKDVLSFCKYLTKNREEAEDLCQDTFVLAFQVQEKIVDGAHAKRFFLSTAIKLWNNRRRKYAWRRRIVEDEVVPLALLENDAAERAGAPEEQVLKDEKLSIVRACVSRLPEKQRLVILLYFMEDFREREIAEILELPIGTVKSRLHKAKRTLSKMLSDLL